MRYRLLSKKNNKPIICIDEDAKQEFMEFMGWNEEQFEKNTEEISDK